MGIIRPSLSTWASPFHGVPKGDGGWLPCGDYRRLNKITTPARYPIPHIQDFGSNWPVKPSFPRSTGCAPTTCSLLPSTPFGLYEFCRMPFGLRNVAQTFQRFIDGVCYDLDFVVVYLDYILVASSSLDEHLQHLRVLFQHLLVQGLVISPAK